MAGDGQRERAVAAGELVEQGLGDPHRAEGVDTKRLLPVVVVDGTDGIPSPPLEVEAGVVDQQVQRPLSQGLGDFRDLVRGNPRRASLFQTESYFDAQHRRR
jgi:hypothetical protein